jgi:hypothetical protein
MNKYGRVVICIYMFLTLVLGGVESLGSNAATLPLDNELPLSNGQKSEWAPERVWIWTKREKSLSLQESNPDAPVNQPIA